MRSGATQRRNCVLINRRLLLVGTNPGSTNKRYQMAGRNYGEMRYQLVNKNLPSTGFTRQSMFLGSIFTEALIKTFLFGITDKGIITFVVS